MPSWAQFSYSVAPSGALLVLSVTADQPVCGAGRDFINIRDKKENINMRYENNQDLVGALKKCTKMRPHRQPRGRRRQQT